jgi:cytochrome c2
MAWLEVDKLLLTVGDMEHDGWYQPIAVAQDDSYLYGKTLTVDVQTGRSEIFTKGHRNPQGLLIDRDGQIWSTEHGPEGGDELNLLTRGKNFGWPYETFGTEYGSYDWPLAGQYSGNDELQEPIFSWVPSIGVSSLIQVTEGQFDRWYGDLLITTLKDRHLYRLEISHGRVLNVEPIKIGRRIRDLIESPTGGYWLWGENGDLVSLSISDSLSHGALLFKSCAACHSTGVLSGGLGPTLLQVVDRDIGGLDDYEDYSPALQAISGVWTEERLDEFLADPQAFVPGTTMIYPGIDDSDERGAIIEYLRNIEQ